MWRAVYSLYVVQQQRFDRFPGLHMIDFISSLPPSLLPYYLLSFLLPLAFQMPVPLQLTSAAQTTVLTVLHEAQ